jgi:hypothetical protein
MDDSGQQNVFSGDLVPVEPSALSRDPRHALLMQTLSEAQVDFLLQRTPRHEVKKRQGRGGMQFSYVEHGYVTERLNLVFGFNWDFEVTDKQILEDEVIVEARLTVRTPGGQTIVKTQFGGAEIKRHASGTKNGRPLSIADDYKAAASDALKKCASLLGVGLDLYGRDRPYDIEEAPADAPPARPRRAATGEVEPLPLHTTPDGLCTADQWRQISRLAGRAGMEVAELCESLGVSTLAQLTEARAERVIKRLGELAAASQADAS